MLSAGEMLGNGEVAGSDFCLYFLVESNFMVICYCSLLVLIMCKSMFIHILARNSSEHEVIYGCMTRDKQ